MHTYMPKDLYLFRPRCNYSSIIGHSPSPDPTAYVADVNHHMVFIAFKLNSTPTKVAAYLSVLIACISHSKRPSVHVAVLRLFLLVPTARFIHERKKQCHSHPREKLYSH